MTWEPRPTPEVTPETEPYWTAAAEERLLLGHCPACGLTFHYPRAVCPDCFEEAEWTTAEGSGTLYSYTVLERASGWPEAELPLLLAYVELDEGPRIMTNVVECDPADATVGMPVTVRFEPTEDGIAVPVFVPDDR